MYNALQRDVMCVKKAFYAVLSALLVTTGIFSLPAQTVSGSNHAVVIAFGDSLTAGGVWLDTLNSRYGLDIINAGIGGNNTNDARARFERDVLAKNPDVVIICFGMNDSALDMVKHIEKNIFKENLRYFITALKGRGARVILATPNYIEESLYYTRHDSVVFEVVGGAAAYVDSYCEAIREIAAEQGVFLADIRAACDEYTNRLDIVTDGVHPTTLGYSLYSALIGKQLERIYRGDVNRDGEINAVDFLMIKRHFLGSYTIPGTRFPHADINGDGVADAKDYLAVKRHYLGTHNIND